MERESNLTTRCWAFWMIVHKFEESISHIFYTTYTSHASITVRPCLSISCRWLINIQCGIPHWWDHRKGWTFIHSFRFDWRVGSRQNYLVSSFSTFTYVLHVFFTINWDIIYKYICGLFESVVKSFFFTNLSQFFYCF